jgi:metallophosphoesterase (TIGR00282 family)
MSQTIKILVVGDTVGRPGRRICQEWVPKIREEESVDFVIVNGENMAGGSGITEKTALELLKNGVDVLTSGDHIFKDRNCDDFFHRDKRVLRPGNYKGKPGFGSGIYTTGDGIKVGVINLIGQVFLLGETVDNPFNYVIDEVNKLKRETPIIILDIHAEATSEKIAMGWHLDGLVSGIFGTHTHVTTADETVLPKGTAYITDVGMTGPYESVLGRDVKAVLHRFCTNGPARFEVAKKDVRLKGAIMEIDIESGKALSIERIERKI